MSKNNPSRIVENVIVQASILVFIGISIFVLLFGFDLFENEILELVHNKLVLSIIFALAVFSVCLLAFSHARYKDILRQKELINQYKIEAKKYKSDIFQILDALPSMAYFAERNSRITWANKTLLKYNNDAIGKFISDVFDCEETTNHLQLIQKTIDNSGIETDIVYYQPNKYSEEEAYFERYYIPLTNINSSASETLLIVSFNITGKMQLKESKGRLTSIVEASQDAIFVVDLNRTIHSWNSAAERIFGYLSKEIVGQPITILDHFIEFETLISIFNQDDLENSRAIKHVELVKLNKRDSTLYVSITMYPFVDDAGNVIGISAIIRDRTEEIAAQEQLEFSEKQMRKLAIHLDAVREEERKQIAFAIHDELGYALSAIKMDISWILKNLDPDNSQYNERIQDMIKLVDVTIQKVKTLSANLRPSILDHFGLIAAIEEQSGEFQRRTGIRCKVSVNPSDIEVDDNLRTPIFRIFQEAQTNITRYAKASRVDVVITHQNGLFTMKVSDNGVGISDDKISSISSFGLLGIREKATSIGGKATITGKPGEGTTVTLELPM